MMDRLYRALRDQRLARDQLDAAVAVTTTPPAKYVRVRLERSGREVVIFVGAGVVTPLGRGTVLTIDADVHKISIQLGFGVMFAHLARAVCWSFDCVDEQALVQFYNEHVADCISLSSSARQGIKSLLASSADLSAEGNGSSSSEEEEETGETTDNDDVSLTDDSGDHPDGGKVSGGAPNPILDALAAVAAASSSRGRVGASEDATGTCGSFIPIFPLPISPNGDATRHTVKQMLKASDIGDPTTSALQVAFASPGDHHL